MRQLNRRGTTILLTTHYLEEAEQLCDSIAIIDHGRIIACDTTLALLNRLDSKCLTLILDRDLERVPDQLAHFDVALTCPHCLTFQYRPSASPVPEILSTVAAAGLSVIDMTTEETDLEDLFLQLTRRNHAAGQADHAG